MARGRGTTGPWGGAVLATLRSELSRRGWPPGLTVLTGDDLFHLDLAQKALLDHLVPAAEAGYALSVFGDQKIDVSEIVGAARSAGMFASRRVVFLRDVEALQGEPGVLAEYARKPPSSSFILVRAPRLDQRRLIHKELAESGRVLVFRSATRGETGLLLKEVLALAAERRLRLEAGVGELLLELGAGDLQRIESELEKIRAFKGGDAPRAVTVADVTTLAAGSGSLSGWELANAILARDRAGALAAARRVMDSGIEPLMTLGGLAWRTRVMLQVKARIAAGARPQEALAGAYAGVPPPQLLEGLSRYSLREILAFPARLLEADRTLKSRSIDPRAVFESLAEDLTGRAEPATPEAR